MSIKEEAIKVIQKLPENCSYEDIQYELYVREKIEKGLMEKESEMVLTHEEVKKRMEKWLM